MPVYPLSQGTVVGDQQCQDGTLGRFEGVLSQAPFEPANLACASQRVDLESPDRGGRVAVDFDHGMIVEPPVRESGYQWTPRRVSLPVKGATILTDYHAEGITDACVGVRLIMHGKADIHGTVQIGHGFGLARRGAGDFVSHAPSIGTHPRDLGVRWTVQRSGTQPLAIGRLIA